MPENCYLCDEPEPVDNHNTATLTAGLSTIISREIKSNRKSKQNAVVHLKKRDLALKEKSKRYFLIEMLDVPIYLYISQLLYTFFDKWTSIIVYIHLDLSIQFSSHKFLFI